MTSPAIVLRPERGKRIALFLRRQLALAQRQMFLLLGSWPRLVEVAYWPTVDVLIWGFASLYIMKTLTNVTIVVTVFLSGVILSELLIRNAFSTMILFIEEMWSRNLGHLFASPMTFFDYTVGLMALSFIRTAISIVPAILIAKYLFHFSLFSLGPPLAAYISLLILNGWWFAFIILSILLRYGLAAEWMGWMLIFGLVPIAAPYYPVSILPAWLQAVSWCLPATYVFESIKSTINGNGLHAGYLWKALGLNIVYFIGTSIFFYRAYQNARRRGGLLQVGE